MSSLLAGAGTGSTARGGIGSRASKGAGPEPLVRRPDLRARHVTAGDIRDAVR
jgi:hypothetical protein